MLPVFLRVLSEPVKNPPAVWETWVQSLDGEGPLEKGTAAPLQYSGLENSERQRNLAGFSPWVHKESGTTE